VDAQGYQVRPYLEEDNQVSAPRFLLLLLILLLLLLLLLLLRTRCLCAAVLTGISLHYELVGGIVTK
jgi:hypothetical protein